MDAAGPFTPPASPRPAPRAAPPAAPVKARRPAARSYLPGVSQVLFGDNNVGVDAEMADALDPDGDNNAAALFGDGAGL